MMAINTNATKEFLAFLKKEIEPAAVDLKQLQEKNRIHIQKLVYTNLVDRFDTMVDRSILDNCREDTLVDRALEKLSEPITEADLVRLLLRTDNLQTTLNIRLEDRLRNSVLRERHSKKLNTLLSIVDPDKNFMTVPRVNVSTGVILETIKPQKNAKTPYSICGYADWLYSRRNSIVHGAGTKEFLENDRKQLLRIYKREPSKTFKILLSSVTNTIVFYKSVINIVTS